MKTLAETTQMGNSHLAARLRSYDLGCDPVTTQAWHGIFVGTAPAPFAVIGHNIDKAPSRRLEEVASH